jgi:hypothetical protein
LPWCGPIPALGPRPPSSRPLPRQNPIPLALYGCAIGDDTCRSFDAATFREGPWIDLGRNADNVRFDPDAQLIYVGSAGEPGHGLLTAIDLISLFPAAQCGQPAPPHTTNRPAAILLFQARP